MRPFRKQGAFTGNQADEGSGLASPSLLFLKTDDFDRDYSAYRAPGVRFVREWKRASDGKAVLFQGLYGNLWDLVQFAA